MRRVKLSAFYLLLISSTVFAEEIFIEKNTANIEVLSSGLGDYVNEIIRIESVRTESGEEVYKRSLMGKYLKKIELPAPATYSFKILCERWYLLEFEHPTVLVDLEPGNGYQVSCMRNEDGVKAVIKKMEV